MAALDHAVELACRRLQPGQRRRERQLLGPDLPIDVIAIDETNTRVVPRRSPRRIADNGGLGLVGIVGVQSNEFPRARRYRPAACAPPASR